MHSASRIALLLPLLACVPVQSTQAEEYKVHLSVGSSHWGVLDKFSVSGDGRWVVFSTQDELDGQANGSTFDNYLLDTETGIRTTLTQDAYFAPHRPESCQTATISADARMIYFTCRRSPVAQHPETYTEAMLFALDRDPDRNGTLDEQSPPVITEVIPNHTAITISANGRRLAVKAPTSDYAPCVTSGGELLVIDRDNDGDGVLDEPGDRQVHCTGITTYESFSDTPIMSGDGRYLLLSTKMPLVAVDTNTVSDIYRWTVDDGTAALVQPGPDGAAIGGGTLVDISYDGRIVLFNHPTTTLDPTTVPGHTNYVRDFVTSETRAVGISATLAGYRTAIFRNATDLTADGRFVAFKDTIYEDLLERGNQTSFVYEREPVRRAFLSDDQSRLIAAVDSTTVESQLYMYRGEPMITIEPEATNPTVITIPHGQTRLSFAVRNRGGKSAHNIVLKAHALENGTVRNGPSQTCHLSPNQVLCPLGWNFIPGSQYPFQVTMLATGLGQMTTQAEVLSIAGQAPDVPIEARHSVQVFRGINPTINVGFSNPVYRGQAKTVQIILRNEPVPGATISQPAFTATNPVLTLEVPPDLTLHFGNLFTDMDGGCAQTGSTLTCRDSGISFLDNRVVRFLVTPNRTGSINYTGSFRADELTYGGATQKSYSGVFTVLEEPPPEPEEPPAAEEKGGGGPVDGLFALFAAVLLGGRRTIQRSANGGSIEVQS